MNPEKPVYIYVDIMFAHWEKKITATEYTAASLIVNENIRVKKATFIGPPPIHRNAAAIPSSNLDSKIAMGFLTLNVLKLPDTKIITHTKKQPILQTVCLLRYLELKKHLTHN